MILAFLIVLHRYSRAAQIRPCGPDVSSVSDNEELILKNDDLNLFSYCLILWGKMLFQYVGSQMISYFSKFEQSVTLHKENRGSWYHFSF